MRGQVAEYVLVFAAVAAIAVIILALSFQEFPYVVIDTQAVIAGVGRGYLYELSSFRDGGIYYYIADYNASAREANVLLQVVGWPLADIRAAVAKNISKYGYAVKWT